MARFFAAVLYLCVVQAASTTPDLLTLHAIGGNNISEQRQSELAAALMALNPDALDQLLTSSGISSMCIVSSIASPSAELHSDKPNPTVRTLHQISWLNDKRDLVRLQRFLDTAVSKYGVYVKENIAQPYPIDIIHSTERIGFESINARPGDDLVIVKCSSVLDMALWDILISNGTEVLIRHDVLQAYGSSGLQAMTGQTQKVVILFRGVPVPGVCSLSPTASRLLEYFQGKVEKAVTISPGSSKKSRRSDFSYDLYRCLACGKTSSGFLQELSVYDSSHLE